jgi:hypothetical protein
MNIPAILPGFSRRRFFYISGISDFSDVESEFRNLIFKTTAERDPGDKEKFLKKRHQKNAPLIN